MERNSRNKPSFNIIDIFILVFVVVCFVGLVMRVGNFTLFDNTGKLDDYRIHFSVSDISSESENYFITGDTLTMVENRLVLGELEMIDSISPSKLQIKNPDNSFSSVMYPQDTRVDVS